MKIRNSGPGIRDGYSGPGIRDGYPGPRIRDRGYTGLRVSGTGGFRDRVYGIGYSVIPDPEYPVPDTSGPEYPSRIPCPGYPVPDTRFRIPGPAYLVPDTYPESRSHIPNPDPDSVFSCGYTYLYRSVYPSVNPPATAVKISICGNGRGKLSVDRSGNRLVTAGLIPVAEISR